MVIPASIAVLFQDAYPSLSETDIGLCYLPIGISLVISSAVGGKLANRFYLHDRERWNKTRGPEDDDDTFSIEWARLKLTYVNATMLAGFSIAYAWSVQKRLSLAVPLVFLVGGG